MKTLVVCVFVLFCVALWYMFFSFAFRSRVWLCGFVVLCFVFFFLFCFVLLLFRTRAFTVCMFIGCEGHACHVKLATSSRRDCATHGRNLEAWDRAHNPGGTQNPPVEKEALW